MSSAACTAGSSWTPQMQSPRGASPVPRRSPLQEGSSQSKRPWTVPLGHTCYFSVLSHAARRTIPIVSSLLLKHNLS